MASCRFCGKSPTQCKGWLERVNEKGVAGIFECRPSCDADLPPDERVLGAIEGCEADGHKHKWEIEPSPDLDFDTYVTDDDQEAIDAINQLWDAMIPDDEVTIKIKLNAVGKDKSHGT